jgi:8-oxo-dGTP pyrophosphatase MutT (NUDIX family)
MKLYKEVLIEKMIGATNKVETVMNVSAGIVYKMDENNRRQVLVIQRSADDHWPNHWELPRGKCDKPVGESLIGCCKREVKEETGLDVKVQALIDTFEYLADQGKRKSICHNFLCELEDPNQEVKLSKEHQRYRWITEMGEAEMMLLPDQKRVAQKVLSNENPIVSQPENDFTKNNSLEEFKIMIDKYLNKIQEDRSDLSTKYKPYDGVIDDQMMKKLMVIANQIKLFSMTKLKSLRSQYYDESDYIDDDDFSYNKNSKPPQLNLSSIFKLVRKDNTDERKACQELMKLKKILLDQISKKFKMVFEKTYDSQIVSYLKDGKIIFSIDTDGDKCDELIFNFIIYGENIKDYHWKPAGKYGFKFKAY